MEVAVGLLEVLLGCSEMKNYRTETSVIDRLGNPADADISVYPLISKLLPQIAKVKSSGQPALSPNLIQQVLIFSSFCPIRFVSIQIL